MREGEVLQLVPLHSTHGATFNTLEYSSVVWDLHLQKDIDKLEKTQRQAARFITGD